MERRECLNGSEEMEECPRERGKRDCMSENCEIERLVGVWARIWDGNRSKCEREDNGAEER